MSRPSKIAGLLLLFLGGACLARPAATYAGTPRISAGFNGYVKPQRGFPVLIEPFPGHTLRHVALMRRRHGDVPPTVVSLFGGAYHPETGGWHALARLPQRYRDDEAFLRCLFLSDTGPSQTVDVPIRNLSQDDLLVLVVSDQPAEFDFMGSIEHGRQQITRAVAGGPEMLMGLRWQDLQTVDFIVLDGPAPARDAHRNVLKHWVLMGGTVLVTARAMLRENGDWGFLDGPGPDAESLERVTGIDAIALLGDQAPHVLAMPFVHAVPQTFIPLVARGAATLVGGRELGRGRILVSALDWTAMEMKEHAPRTPARRALWLELFQLRRQSRFPHPPQQAAIPREAQVRFLMVPLLLFLLGCCLLLGPLNGLVLRTWGRREYMVVTLPAGAALLAFGAIVAGHAWRPRDIIIKEVSAVFDGGTAAWEDGISGILSPAFRDYAVITPHPDNLLHEAPLSGGVLHAVERASPASMIALGDDGMRIEGISIERWAMQFFAINRPVDDGHRLRAEAQITAANRLAGTLHNHTPHALRDVWVISDADRSFVGDLAPHATRSFDLILRDPRDDPSRRCAGCGQYHRDGNPFEDRDGEPSMAPEFKTLGPVFLAGRHQGPYAIGMIDAEYSTLEVLQPEQPLQRRQVRMIAAPVVMHWPETPRIPSRFIHRLTVSDAYDRESWNARLRNLPLQFVPHGLAARTAFLRSPTAVKPDIETWQAPRSAVYQPPAVLFALPAIHASSVLRIAWDRQVSGADARRDDAIVLETLDWERDRWTVLGTVTNGLREFTLTGADRAVLTPAPALALRERRLTATPGDPVSGARFRRGTLSVEVVHDDTVID